MPQSNIHVGKEYLNHKDEVVVVKEIVIEYNEIEEEWFTVVYYGLEKAKNVVLKMSAFRFQDCIRTGSLKEKI